MDLSVDKAAPKGKRAITGDVDLPDEAPVVRAKQAGDDFYELMPLNYYASMDHEKTHPIRMSEIKGTLGHVLKKDLYPLFGQTIAPPLQGWTIRVKQGDARADGSPAVGYVHLESSAADMLVAYDVRRNAVEILGVDPDLAIDAVAMGRLSALLANAAKNRDAVVKDGFLQGRSKANLGLEIRRGLVCAQPSVLYTPTVEGLAATEKRITLVARTLLARVWEATPRPVSGGKKKAPPRFQALTEWAALGLEGSKPVHWRGAINRDVFADSRAGDIDDISIAKIKEFTDDLHEYNPNLMGCLDSEVLYQEGIRDACVRLARMSPLEQPLMGSPEMFALQCLGVYPSGTVAVYKHQRNTKGGIVSEYRQEICRGSRWEPPVALDDAAGERLLEECRASHGGRSSSSRRRFR